MYDNNPVPESAEDQRRFLQDELEKIKIAIAETKTHDIMDAGPAMPAATDGKKNIPVPIIEFTVSKSNAVLEIDSFNGIKSLTVNYYVSYWFFFFNSLISTF